MLYGTDEEELPNHPRCTDHWDETLRRSRSFPFHDTTNGEVRCLLHGPQVSVYGHSLRGLGDVLELRNNKSDASPILPYDS